MDQPISINQYRSIHDMEIKANVLFFLPAIRRVRAENDKPATEVEPQIAAT